MQRVFVAACLIVTVASLSLGGLIWHQSNQAVSAAANATRQLTEAQNAHQAKLIELLTQSQTTSAEMLKQLQTIAKPGQATRSPDWIRVTFKLTVGSLDGRPAEGYEVRLIKGSSGLLDGGIVRESDSRGLADFGVVGPGDWAFEISRESAGPYTWMCQGSFNILPGADVNKTIVCPPPQSEQAAVKLQLQWPADLATKDLRVEVTFVQAPVVLEPSLKWKLVNSFGKPKLRSILFGPGMKQTDIGGSTKLELWHLYGEPLSMQHVFGDFQSDRSKPQTDANLMDLGNYFPEQLIVLRPSSRPNAARKGDRFEVLAHAQASDSSGLDVQTLSGEPVDGREALASWPLKNFQGGVTVDPSYWRQREGRFEVRPGKLNEWTLSLPEELIKVVREQLEAKEIPQAQANRADGID